MKIERINDNLVKITPREDMHLTQADLEESAERVFCCSAYELTEDDKSKWVEWTEEQKIEFESNRQK